jgi:hypothetical protein
MVIASSISGLPIYAPSAAFAPTNSGEVSAIASAYQVVSSTATQLYAGTAYVTSVNDAPISASRAGNAANASMANSAYYDGTGRLISALPDSATVSAIASSYAESAASGKQDELTFSYDDDKISAINGSALAGQGGGEQVVTSLQYVVTDPTSKYELYQPAGTTSNYMSSNLLALEDTAYGMGQYNLSSLFSFDLFMTGIDTNIFGYYSASVSAMIVKASASGRQPWEWSPSDTAFGGTLVNLQTGLSGYDPTGSARVSTQGIRQYGSSWPDGTPFYDQPPLIFFTTASGNYFVQGTARIGTAYGSASYVNTALEGESSISGVNELPLYVDNGSSVSAIAEAYAQSAAQAAVSSVSGDYYPRYSNPSHFVPSGDVVMQTSVGSSDKFITSISGTPFMATDSALATRLSDTASSTAYQTASVNFEADAVSRSVVVSLNGPSTPYITAKDSYGGYVGTGSIELTWDPTGNNYTGQYIVTSTAAVSANIFAYNDLSASAICGYTVPLAHASAVSSKADSSALSSYVPYSSLEYNTASAISGINGSALAAGSTYSAGEGIDITDDVISVETPVDIVAGPGIVIDNPDGNTLRVSVDQAMEVVLWSGDTQPLRTTSMTINLSEPVTNFELVRFEGLNSYAGLNDALLFANTVPVNTEMPFGNNLTVSNGSIIVEAAYATVSGSSLSLIGAGRSQSNSSGVMTHRTDRGPSLYKVVGIHRIANN